MDQHLFARAVDGDDLALAALLNAPLRTRMVENGTGGEIGQHLLGLDVEAVDETRTDGERRFADGSRIVIRVLLARIQRLSAPKTQT